jgi:diadenosine tetraphosphatase ApaH/serine/threonine PP2A family protein phosphatase
MNTEQQPTQNNEPAASEPDSFDRLYLEWAKQALNKQPSPPSRERWDKAILFLLSSKDPDRVRRYSRVDTKGDDTLGADAYELWGKMPPYTEQLTAPVHTEAELREYEVAHRGSMKRLMEARGLGERYREIIEKAQAKPDPARVRAAQARVITIGCVGMALIGVMVLVVLLVIVIKLLSPE